MPRNTDRDKKRKARKANEKPLKKQIRKHKRLRKKGEVPYVVCVYND